MADPFGIEIHKAAERGDVEALRRELAAGTDVDVRTPVSEANDGYQTPLQRALVPFPKLERSVLACCRLLLEAGADVNARDAQGDSVLHYIACRCNNAVAIPILRLLIDAGADVNARGKQSKTPLHWAAEYRGSAKAIEFLLRAGAAANAKKDGDNTPLNLAIIYKYHRYYPLLLHAGAELPTEEEVGNDPYLRAVIAAGGFEKYANQHLAAITALFVRTDRPRLPPEMVRHIFSYWLHGGYYLY